MLRGHQRSHRRRVFLLSWFLEELQVVIESAVARGIRIAFSEKRRLSDFESSRQFADRAPFFDLRVEESDDGR